MTGFLSAQQAANLGRGWFASEVFLFLFRFLSIIANTALETARKIAGVANRTISGVTKAIVCTKKTIFQ